MLTASDTSLTLATWKSIKNKHESSESIFYDVIYHHTIWTKNSTCPGRKKNKKFHVYFWGGNESKFDQTTKWTNCSFFSIVRWIFFPFYYEPLKSEDWGILEYRSSRKGQTQSRKLTVYTFYYWCLWFLDSFPQHESWSGIYANAEELKSTVFLLEQL